MNIYIPLEKEMATVFLLGKSHGQRSLAAYSLWGCKELDMAEVTERLRARAHTHTHTHALT